MGQAESIAFLDKAYWFCTSAKIVGVAVGICLTLYMLRQQEKSRQGDASAATSLILPIYFPVLVILLLTMSTEIALLLQSKYGEPFDAWQYLFWGVYELSRDGFVMLFVQKSLSQRALFRSLVLAMLWPAFGIACAAVLLKWASTPEQQTGVSIVYHGGSALFNLIMALPLPAAWQFKRASIAPYCLWMAIYRSTWVVYYIMSMGYVTFLAYPIVILAFLMELPVTTAWYWVMRQDTLYWHYGGHPSWKTWKEHEEVLQRLEVGLLSDAADSVVQQDVQDLIESSRDHLVHFGALKVDNEQPIGAGSFSRVFQGTYKRRPVAVKFFVRFTELVPDMVAAFARETALHAKLQHENVVKFYGLCVAPPAISLVTELCAKGSLLERIMEQQALRLRHGSFPSSSSSGSGSGSASSFAAYGQGSADGSQFGSSAGGYRTDPRFPGISPRGSPQQPQPQPQAGAQVQGQVLSAASDVSSLGSASASSLAGSSQLSSNGGGSAMTFSPVASSASAFGSTGSTSSCAAAGSMLSSAPGSLASVASSPVGSGVFAHAASSLDAEAQFERDTGVWALLTRLSLARDAAAAVAFIHTKGVIHRDIKSPNFLVAVDVAQPKCKPCAVCKVFGAMAASFGGGKTDAKSQLKGAASSDAVGAASSPAASVAVASPASAPDLSSNGASSPVPMPGAASSVSAGHQHVSATPLRLKLTDFGLTRALLSDPRFLRDDHAPLGASEGSELAMQQMAGLGSGDVHGDVDEEEEEDDGLSIDRFARAKGARQAVLAKVKAHAGDSSGPLSVSYEGGDVAGRYGAVNDATEASKHVSWQGISPSTSNLNRLSAPAAPAPAAAALGSAGAAGAAEAPAGVVRAAPARASASADGRKSSLKASAKRPDASSLLAPSSSASSASSAAASMGSASSSDLDERLAVQDRHLTRGVGTALWMAPEVRAGLTYGFPADVYSVAIVMWEVLASDLPPDVRSTDWVPPFPADVPPALAEAVRQGVHPNPALRPSAAHLLKVASDALAAVAAVASSGLLATSSSTTSSSGSIISSPIASSIDGSIPRKP